MAPMAAATRTGGNEKMGQIQMLHPSRYSGHWGHSSRRCRRCHQFCGLYLPALGIQTTCGCIRTAARPLSIFLLFQQPLPSLLLTLHHYPRPIKHSHRYHKISFHLLRAFQSVDIIKSDLIRTYRFISSVFKRSTLISVSAFRFAII